MTLTVSAPLHDAACTAFAATFETAAPPVEDIPEYDDDTDQTDDFAPQPAPASTGSTAKSRPAKPSPPQRFRAFPKPVPGQAEFFTGDTPKLPPISLTVAPGETGGAPGIFALTTSAIEVFHFTSAKTTKREWEGRFPKPYPRRGFAGGIHTGKFKGRQMIYVSLNKVPKSAAYRWTENGLEKSGRISTHFAGTGSTPGINIMATYGKGIITFDPATTTIVDTSGPKPTKTPFHISGDYFSACAMKIIKSDPPATRIATATGNGEIRVYESPSKPVFETAPSFGGIVLCPHTATSSFVITTTTSWKNDAIVVLEYKNGRLEEKWRSQPFPGAITTATIYDFDSDGMPEIFGIVEKPAGSRAFFRIRPKFGS